MLRYNIGYCTPHRPSYSGQRGEAYGQVRRVITRKSRHYLHPEAHQPQLLSTFSHLVFLLWLSLKDEAMCDGGGLVCQDVIATLSPPSTSVR